MAPSRAAPSAAAPSSVGHWRRGLARRGSKALLLSAALAAVALGCKGICRQAWGSDAAFAAAATQSRLSSALTAGAPSARPGAAGDFRGSRLGRRAGGEDFSLWAPDQRVVQAVQQLGGRVTKADVLAKGVEARGLERELLQLARASGAALRVNSKGELLYEFPRDLAGALAKTNSAAKLQQVWDTVFPWVSYAGRVAFGASLLVTVLVLYSAVLVLLTTSVSEKEDKQGNRTSVVSQDTFSLWFGNDLFSWLTPRPYGYYSYGYYDPWGYSAPPPKMSFFESVFSFVFGDGDPNQKLLAETRWQRIGEVIAENGGSVVAEQVAPYLDPPTKPGETAADAQRALDKAMLPVLLRFKGRPEVDSKGDIVYVFPELQESRSAGEAIVGDVSTKELKQRLANMGFRTSAVERPDIVAEYLRRTQELRRRASRDTPGYLPERELKFSEADEGQIAGCIAYGAFALLATLFLGSQILTGKALVLARVYPIMGLVVQLFPWLLGYTGAFLGIPLWRWLRLPEMNEEIAQRNAWRIEQARRLERPDPSLRERLLGAANWAKARLGFGEAVYDTSESPAARNARSEEDDLKAFDRRLQGR